MKATGRMKFSSPTVPCSPSVVTVTERTRATVVTRVSSSRFKLAGGDTRVDDGVANEALHGDLDAVVLLRRHE